MSTNPRDPPGASPAPETTEHRRWHALHAAEAVAAVKSDDVHGLSVEDARGRLERFGANALPSANRRTLLAIFAHQFKSPLIFLLVVAAGVALALGHTKDALVIFVVLFLNALIGSLQEGRAERSLESLRRLATHRARVVRSGRQLTVEARELVPGDIVLLEAGDAIAADARLVEGASLQIAEAALTGESVPVGKALVPLAPDTPLADRHNMVYAGTHVTAGRARVVVVATGLATEIGHIATLAEEADEPKTPLEQRIARFGRSIIVAAGGLFLLVTGVGWLRGISFGEILMVAIRQVVSMVPEGLPVAMTVALAVGVQRMARRNAVVRRLGARRDPRVDHRHLHRQDGHAHEKRDDGDRAPPPRGPRPVRHRERLRAGRPLPREWERGRPASRRAPARAPRGGRALQRRAAPGARGGRAS